MPIANQYKPKRGLLSRMIGAPLQTLGAIMLLVIAGACAWIYVTAGVHGFNVVLRRGMTTWTAVTRDDARLSPAMRAALEFPTPAATPGKLEWRTVAPGLDVADLPVMAKGSEVDTIMLTRLDPARHTFRVLTAPSGNMDLDDWARSTKATVILNGSFFSRKGSPETPILSDGRAQGPTDYTASHGAFVASDTAASVRDLVKESWTQAFTGATQGMVSYPLLIDKEGTKRTQRSDIRWVANRSFVGQDSQGRIVLGTTKEAFFALDRFAEFLRAAGLDLQLALNLDGGPSACQSVTAGQYARNYCGKGATQTDANGQLKLLGSLFGQRRWALPIVLAAFAR